jgi:hypothetical protein
MIIAAGILLSLTQKYNTVSVETQEKIPSLLPQETLYQVYLGGNEKQWSRVEEGHAGQKTLLSRTPGRL